MINRHYKIVNRQSFVSFFIVTLILIQGAYIIFPIPEIWPFSPYPMYSKAREFTTVSGVEIRGVLSNDQEITLDISEYFTPFDRNKLRSGIRKILIKNEPLDAKEKKMNVLFNYLLDQYKHNKNVKHHQGSDIKILRLYGVSWNWKDKTPLKTDRKEKLIYQYK